MFDSTPTTAIAELAVALVAWTGIWYAIGWREQAKAARGPASHSGLRFVNAAAAMLLMLFSGGCTLFFGAKVLQDYMSLNSSDVDGRKVLGAIIGVILVVEGKPFAVATVAWFDLMVRKKP